ncbi:MAG: hypothetical protein LUC36_00550 [Oscillospiraceae bacterium]|nr:hypothetical protein [Oscillospiraceae bacterium]
MKRQKLNYHFHNPNTPEATADFILKVFIEANMPKVEAAIKAAAAAERSKEAERLAEAECSDEDGNKS